MRRRGPRAVLALGVLVGVATAGFYLLDRPWTVGINFRAYRTAAVSVLDGGPIYGVAPPDLPDMTYKYPPGTVLAFLPTALLPWKVGYAVHTLTGVAAALGVAAVGVRLAEEMGATLARTDRALVAGYALLSGHVSPSLIYGNVNPHLALAVGLSAVALVVRDPPREGLAGVALAVPAVVKAFPAALGAWLLDRRAWRAVAASVAVGAATLAVGLLAFGVDAHLTYVHEVLFGRLRREQFAGGLDPTMVYVTVRRPLSVAGVPVDLLPVAALAVLAPPVALLYRWAETAMDALLALHGTVLAVVVAIPAFPLYLVLAYPTLVPALYAMRGPGRRLVLVGAGLFSVVASYGTLLEVLRVLGAEGAVVADVARPVLSLSTPMLAGSLLMLLGCLRAVRASERKTDGGDPRGT